MNVKKILDKFLGIPLCILLYITRKIFKNRKNERMKEKNKIKKILIIKFFGIGDCVLLFNSINSLKNKYKNANIYALTTEYLENVFKLNPNINKIISLDTSLTQFLKTFSKLLSLKKENFDLLIDFEQFSRFSALIAFFSDAKIKVGFDIKKRYRSFLYNIKIPYDFKKEEEKCFFDLLRAIKVPVLKNKINKFKYKQTKFIKNFFKKNNISGNDKLISLAFESTLSQKELSRKKIVELIYRLLKLTKIKILLLGSNKKMAFEYKKDSKVIDMRGKIILNEVITLINKSDLVIGVDNGLIHIAYLLNKPVIALFGPTNPKKWAHGLKNYHLIYKNLQCSPCSTPSNTKYCLNNKCMKKIQVDNVIKKINKIYPEWGV